MNTTKPTSLSKTSSSFDNSPDRIARIVDQAIAAYTGLDSPIGISVGVVAKDREVYLPYGLAIRANSTPVTRDTVFLIGSVQKIFTSTLLATQVIEGRMRLDDQVTKFLPEEVGASGSAIRQVTPVALSTMTAAMPRKAAGRPGDNLYRDLPPTEDFIQFLQSFNPTARIGAKPLYSNVGVVTLAFSVVGAAGMSYNPLLNQKITGPLLMPDTVVDVSGYPAGRVAVGYTSAGKPLGPKARGVGLSSTAVDMLRFLRANLFMTPCLPPELTLAMNLAHQPHFRNSPTMCTGLNWYIDEFGSFEIIGKNGGNSGFAAWTGFIPGRELGIVLLSNGHPKKSSSNLTRTGMKILADILGEKLPPPSAEAGEDRPIEAED